MAACERALRFEASLHRGNKIPDRAAHDVFILRNLACRKIKDRGLLTC